MDNPWVLDGVAFLLLCFGFRFGQPRLVRALSALAILYLLVFGAGTFVWLKWQLLAFKAHPDVMHIGISAAFIFQGFWRLLGNMVLLYGIMPLAMVFLVYFIIKWVATPLKESLFS